MGQRSANRGSGKKKKSASHKAKSRPDIAKEKTMETPLQRAAKVVASACAASSNFVKVVSLDPLKTVPETLFLNTFKSVLIQDQDHMDIFRQHLLLLLPDKFAPDLQPNNLPLSPDLLIGPVVNYVEALIWKLGIP